MNKEELQKEHGEVWDTKEATTRFEFLSFLAPFAFVIRMSDGLKGSIMFQDKPRFYFGFKEVR